jgi:hypothetical protein
LLYSKVIGYFRAKLTTVAIEYFKANSVLKFIGVGDKLIEAIAKGIRYVSVDSNHGFQRAYT